MNNMNFPRATQKAMPHNRAGQWAAHKGRPAGCGKACRTTLLYSPPARPSVLCAALQIFTFFIWKHGPPAHPILQLVLSIMINQIWNVLKVSRMPENIQTLWIQYTENSKQIITQRQHKQPISIRLEIMLNQNKESCHVHMHRIKFKKNKKKNN